MSAFRLVVQSILLKICCFIPEIVAIMMSNSHKQGIVVWYYPKNLRFDRVRTYLQITQIKLWRHFLIFGCGFVFYYWFNVHGGNLSEGDAILFLLSAQERIVLYKSPSNLEKQRALNSRFFRVIFIPVTAALIFFFDVIN